MAYMFFGLGLERPGRLNELISELISNQLRAVPRRVPRPVGKEGPLEEPPQLKHWLTRTELTGEPRDVPGKRKALAALIRKYPRENILRACATISALFNFGPEGNTTADDALTEAWIPRLFLPDLVQSLLLLMLMLSPTLFE